MASHSLRSCLTAQEERKREWSTTKKRPRVVSDANQIAHGVVAQIVAATEDEPEREKPPPLWRWVACARAGRPPRSAPVWSDWVGQGVDRRAERLTPEERKGDCAPSCPQAMGRQRLGRRLTCLVGFVCRGRGLLFLGEIRLTSQQVATPA